MCVYKLTMCTLVQHVLTSIFYLVPHAMCLYCLDDESVKNFKAALERSLSTRHPRQGARAFGLENVGPRSASLGRKPGRASWVSPLLIG
jgi:hypothetical protein